VLPFSGIVAVPNALVIDGGLATVRFADAVLPVPPFVELTAPLTFVNCPDAVPTTFTATVHDELSAILPPIRLTLLESAVALAVPPQEFVSPLGVATTKPAGNASVNAAPVSATPFAAEFVSVNVSVLVPFSAIVVGENALLMLGGATTVRLAVAVPPVPPFVELTAPVVFVNCPATVPVTFTKMVHEELAAIVPPVRLALVPPAVAEAVPPHELVSPLGVATTKPVGNVSANATPVSATVFPAGFVIVNASVLAPFSGIDVGENALLIAGGATTVTLAVPALPVPPSFEVACTELFCSPAETPSTFIDTIQLELASNSPLERLTAEEPGTA
jgi:hypothetical protein